MMSGTARRQVWAGRCDEGYERRFRRQFRWLAGLSAGDLLRPIVIYSPVALVQDRRPILIVRKNVAGQGYSRSQSNSFARQPGLPHQVRVIAVALRKWIQQEHDGKEQDA